jgi:hypothetical protein
LLPLKTFNLPAKHDLTDPSKWLQTHAVCKTLSTPLADAKRRSVLRDSNRLATIGASDSADVQARAANISRHPFQNQNLLHAIARSDDARLTVGIIPTAIKASAIPRAYVATGD